jgi:hypothetical protein
MFKKSFVYLGIFILMLGSTLTGAEEIVPICDIKVNPEKVNLTDRVTINVSDTQNAQSIEVEVYDTDGMMVATRTLTPDSPVWQTGFVKPGQYVFRAKAIAEDGTESVNPCEVTAHVNAPPVCKVWTTCLPCDECVGKPVFFEASFSSDPDGQIVQADFIISDLETGEVLDTFNDLEAPFSWEKVFDKPGFYRIQAVVTDDFGAESEPCSIPFEIIQDVFYIVIEGGPMFAQEEDGVFIAARLGILYEIVPDFVDAIITVGGAFPLSGEPSLPFFNLNGLINLHPGRFFFGGGIGYSDRTVDGGDASVELVGNFGFDFVSRCTSKLDGFFELRAPLKKDRSFSDYSKYLIGIRFLF